MLFSRPDGTLATDVAPYRVMMPFIMPTRTESAVHFEQSIDLTKTLAFIEQWNLWAAVKGIGARPRLNRFVMGSRIWQRDGIYISFAAKKKLEDGAPLAVLKRRFDPSLSRACSSRTWAA